MLRFVKHSLTIILFSVIVYSCKKADVNVAPVAPATTPTPVSISTDASKDSVLMNTKDLYLWYKQIPASFDAKTYADPIKIMEAIRPYSIEPGFPTAVDKWSFGIKKSDWNNLTSGMSSASGNGNSEGDFGISVFFKQDGDLRVRMAERLSNAGLAGIQRGWRITKINNSTDLTIANATFIIDNVYNSTSTSFTFLKPDGTSVDLTLNASHYKTQPVYLDTIYSINNKKIGYLVFTSFIGDTTQMNANLARVFSNFASNNITDLIVDLRYNGGGYVSAQEKMADYIVPNSGNGSLMMKEEYNDKNTQNNVSTYFNKMGSLNLSKVYFLVTRNTASASELLINNLKPFMDVKLIGPSNTDGKPVGFFPVPAGDYLIFPVSFKSFNHNGEGNYFNGLQVSATVADGLDKNWGDATETMLASALKHITSGMFIREEGYSEDPHISEGNRTLNRNAFTGMFRLKK